MKNESLKACLDDALSGIEASPDLYQQVLRRAKSEEKPPVPFRIPLIAALIAALLLATAGVGIAASRGWNVLDFLFGAEKSKPEMNAAVIEQQAASDGACLTVESALYDGKALAFDWSIENKHADVPMYCVVEDFSVNGVRIGTDGTDGFDQQWLPGAFSDGGMRDGEYLLLPEAVRGADPLHIDMKITLYRPERPVYWMDSFDPAAAVQKISEGYYVIAEGEGFVAYDRQENQWIHCFGGKPPVDMGAYRTEQLTLSFDLSMPESQPISLKTEESYENAYCVARYETAEITPLGLYLTLQITPKDDSPLWRAPWFALTDGDGQPLTDADGEEYFPAVGEVTRQKDQKTLICQFAWNGIQAERLPNGIFLTCILDSGEKMIFPLRVK